MMMLRQQLTLCGASLLLLSACSPTPTAPAHASPGLGLEQQPAPGQSARHIAAILFYHDPIVIDVPASAHPGQPVDLAITTYGGGCISEDTTVVSTSGLLADVVPYQRVYTPKPPIEGCTMELRITRRLVPLVFSTPGVATVRVTGRAAPGDSLVQVLRAVVVR